MTDEASLYPGGQILLDFEHPVDSLPPQEEFPLTIKQHKRQIKKTLLHDIKVSKNCLIVTGFTSLSQIIKTFGINLLPDKQVCILLGNEPDVRKRKSWKEAALSQEIKDYWLEKGISPLQCGEVLKTIQHIESGQLQFKILDKLHAKLYITEAWATLGSSNFSNSGLAVQHEANIRTGNNQTPDTTRQYEAIKSIGDYYWHRSQPYATKMIALLNELLIIVDWQEALARAVAELLQGQYVKEYLKTFEQAGVPQLWPSQSSGIHQGLQVLQQMGSLLVADPTGSGKTKMITTLQLAMVNWLWETGRGLKFNTVVVAPPLVTESWKREQLQLGRIPSEPISQGILSWPDADSYKLAAATLRIANLLVLDEAHNYLNSKSARSLSISAHHAEFLILSTATPINKRAEDLLRLVQLLDPDNLGDAELRQFKELYRKPVKALEDDETVVQQLRSYIWKFTLRRTKEDLNRMIRKEREKYTNQLNDRCQYPEPKNHFYKTGESKDDIELAKQIEAVSADLKGLIYLKTINRPGGKDLSTPEKRRAYIQGRLNAANGLSRYRVQATLRSSRVALIELVEGTKAAEAFADLSSTGKETGYILQTIKSMQVEMPEYSTFWDVLPEWLTNDTLFRQACEEEYTIYEKISALAKSMNDNREQAKANALLRIMQRHALVIAFDHTIITLHYLHKLIANQECDCHVISGNNKSSKQILLKHFGLGSDSRNRIALCSDVVSEGVNLQAAPTVVMLDMPSVLRLAEQRIGRIDRLDSPHKSIHIYWPDDSEHFQLRSDRNLIRTSQITKQLMGANLHLPEELLNRYEDLKPMSAKNMVAELKNSYKEQEAEWGGMKDAFGEVHRLIEGADALLSEKEYKEMAASKASVKCKLSFVKAEQSWAFIALRSSKETVSRWIFINSNEEVITDFSMICSMLRERLTGTEKMPFAEEELNRFIYLFRRKERETLPHKKRRALHVAESILQKQLADENKKGNTSLASLIAEVLELFEPALLDDVAIDSQGLAMQWLNILSPQLNAWREQKRRRQWLSLEDLLTHPRKHYFPKEQLQHVLNHVPVTEPLHLQIAACIVGIPQDRT